MRNLRNLLHPHATKPTETTQSATPLPARACADRHALDHKPPGYPRLRVNSTRADRGPIMPPMPAIRGDFWIFAGRAARSRSNNLVISTTEQHAALPYQGCAGRRLAAVRIDLG